MKSRIIQNSLLHSLVSHDPLEIILILYADLLLNTLLLLSMYININFNFNIYILSRML